jgi:hypothetical protein
MKILTVEAGSSGREKTADEPAFMALKKWTASVGVTAITAWRWRRDGMLETINIAGRPYVTREGIEKFKQRAIAGEFAKNHPCGRKVAAV